MAFFELPEDFSDKDLSNGAEKLIELASKLIEQPSKHRDSGSLER